MKKSIIIAALALGAPFAVNAADLSYNFGELDYGRMTGGGASENAYGLGADYSFTDDMYAVLGYSHASTSGVNLYGLGVGWHTPIKSDTDFFAELSYLRDFGVNGYGLGAGVRSMVSDELELNARADWAHFSGSSGNSYGVGGVYYFGQDLGVTLDYTHDSNSSTNLTTVGIRKNF